MKNYNEILKKVQLFQNIAFDDLDKIMACFDAKIKKYEKNEIILLQNDQIENIGIVLSGEIQINKEDLTGNKTIFTQLIQYDLFAETFICAGVNISPVNILALTDCEIMFIQYKKVISPCSSACDFHKQLIENMLQIVAKKNYILNAKIEVLSGRTIKEKLMIYLTQVVEKTGETTFTIPFSREELADYLCVNRSALSRELSQLQADGVLTFDKNKFTLIPIPI